MPIFVERLYKRGVCVCVASNSQNQRIDHVWYVPLPKIFLLHSHLHTPWKWSVFRFFTTHIIGVRVNFNLWRDETKKHMRSWFDTFFAVLGVLIVSGNSHKWIEIHWYEISLNVGNFFWAFLLKSCNRRQIDAEKVILYIFQSITKLQCDLKPYQWHMQKQISKRRNHFFGCPQV